MSPSVVHKSLTTVLGEKSWQEMDGLSTGLDLWEISLPSESAIVSLSVSLRLPSFNNGCLDSVNVNLYYLLLLVTS